MDSVTFRHMSLPTYTIKTFGARTGKGRTEPFTGTLDAIVKSDGEEAAYAVYNEYVTLRLGQILSLPLMAGVPVAGPTGLLFASLRLNETGMSLPDMHAKRISRVVERYPKECAAILAFDCWIGNDDRYTNIKAHTGTAPIMLFRAFDHESALLGSLMPPDVRLQELADGKLFIDGHPFAGKISYKETTALTRRIQKLTEFQVAECCCLEVPLHGVTTTMQIDLTKALISRRSYLPDLLATVTLP
jgi:hypothetical protein